MEKVTFIAIVVLVVFVARFIKQWKKAGSLESDTTWAPTEAEYSSLIGKNAEAYFEAFKKFRTNDGVARFSPTWHWPAFLMPWIWMPYRKIKGWWLRAIVFPFVVLGMILSAWLVAGYPESLDSFTDHFLLKLVVAVLLANALLGATANYIYFAHLNPTKARLQRINLIAKSVVMVGSLAWFVNIMAIQFGAWSQRVREASVGSSLRDCERKLQGYFAEHDRYPVTVEEGGCRFDDHVILLESRLTKESFTLVAQPKVRTKYYLVLSSGRGDICKRPIRNGDDVHDEPEMACE